MLNSIPENLPEKIMLTTETMPPQNILDKFNALKDTSPYAIRFAEVFSDAPIPDGTWVVYYHELGNSFFQLTQVIKTDKRGIVKTTSGIDFSKKNNCTYISTQKLEGEKYAVLYGIDKAFERLQKALEQSAANERVATYYVVRKAIARLNPHIDKDLIDQLKNILKQEGKL